MPLSRYLQLIAGLKWTLTVRHFQRHTGSAVMSIIALSITTLVLLTGLAIVGLYLHTAGHAERATFLFWTAWIGTFLWLMAPMSQLDAQRNIDLTGLRLYPLSRWWFTLAVLADGALSPLCALSLLAALAIGIGYTTSLGEFLLLVPTLLLLGLFQLGCAQAVYLLGNRILTSRRFGDASMVLGLVIFLGLQFFNLAMQNGLAHLPPWLRETLDALRVYFAPLGQWLAPGVAARGFEAASQGWLVHAAGLYGLLAAQCAAALLLAAWAARMFYEGEIESGGAARAGTGAAPAPGRTRRAPLHAATGGSQTRPYRTTPSILGALLWRERTYLWRDPLVKMQLLQSLFGTLYLAAVLVLLPLRHGGPLYHARLEIWGKYMLLGLALGLGLTESAVLFNKFGYEGGQVANLLITPVNRRALLASKSLHLVTHFAPLNMALALLAGVALHAPPLFIALALLLVLTNTLLLDIIGQYVSILYPFAYRRVGRRLRAVMPQPGCGYVFVYMLVFQLCHLLTLPVSALSIALSLVFGWPGFAGAIVCSGAVAFFGYRIGLGDAAYRLLQREPQLLATLAKGAE